MNLAHFARLLGILGSEDLSEEESFGERISRARQYADARFFRADLVDELPESAPRGYLLVTPGDPFLYVGTGLGSALRRIRLEALP